MKIGLQIPNFTWPGSPASIGPKLAEIARAAEAAGFYSIWVMDHFFQIGNKERTSGLGPAEDEMLESYSTLGYLAGHTQHVKLGALVTGVIYRYPGLLVKTVTTLDVLSGGRAYLGIGAGWIDREARGLGLPFPPLAERFQRLEEALQIAHQMWAGSSAPYAGRHFQLAEPISSPQPISQPHPPIMIGGSGEAKTLRLVAQYADACNFFGQLGINILQQKLDVLKRHFERLGRDYAQIEKTTLSSASFGPGQQTAAEVIENCRAQAAIGVQHAIFNMRNVEDITPLEIFGREIIPAVAGL
ncbi:MAG: LLM class F420-dependent oxidoreductase [Anaerolineales bacterium]